MDSGILGLPRKLAIWNTDTIYITRAPVATTFSGVLNLGDGAFDGVSTGKFIGNAAGTYLAVNATSTSSVGNLIDLQIAGGSVFRVDAFGNTFFSSASMGGAIGCSSIGAANRSTGSGIVFSTTAPVIISSINAAVSPLVVKSVVSQTADLQQWQLSDGTIQARVDANGRFTANQIDGTKIAYQSLNAYQIQSVSGSCIVGALNDSTGVGSGARLNNYYMFT